MYIYHRLNSATLKVEKVTLTWSHGIDATINQKVETCQYATTSEEFDDVNFIMCLATVADDHLLAMWHHYRKVNRAKASITCAAQFVKMIERHVIE